MNNIYKVIWSKAKNCYVVASEIARSHTKSATGSGKIGGVTRRSLLASLMALSLLCGGLGVASATDVVHVDESATGTAEVYTKTKVDTELGKKADKTAVEEIKNTVGGVDSGLVKKTTDNATGIETNRTNINTLKETVGDDTKGLIKKTNDNAAAINNLTTNVNAKADATALGEYAKTTDVNAQLANKADTTAVTTLDGRVGGVEGKVTALETKVGDASSGLVKDVADLKNQGNDLNTAIGTKANQSDLVAATNRITANEGNITALQTTTNGQQTAIDGLNAKTTKITYDAALGTSVDGVTFNAGAVTGVKSINGIDLGTKESGSYISQDGSIWGNMKIVDTQVKTNADNIQTNANNIKKNTDEIARVNGELVKTNDYFNKELGKTNDYFNKELSKTNDYFNTELGKTNAALQEEGKARAEADAKINTKIGNIDDTRTEYVKNANSISQNLTTLDEKLQATNDRTGGIKRNTEDTQTTIEDKVTVNSNGDVGGVKGLSAETINTTGDAAIGGKLNVTGASDLKGDVTLGTPNGANTVMVNGKADFNEAANMNKGLNVTSGDTDLKNTTVDGTLSVNKETTLKKTDVDGALTVEGEAIFKDKVTMDKDLEVKGELKTDKIAMENKKTDADGTRYNSSTTITADGITHIGEVEKNGVITKSQFTHTEKGSETYAMKGDATDWTETRSDLTADGVNTEVKDSKGNRTNTSQTKEGINGFAIDKDGNSSTTSQTAKDINGNVTDKDGNKTDMKVTATKNSIQIQDKDGKNTNLQVNTMGSSVTEIKNEEGKTTKTEQTATDITNTAEQGTIKNNAMNIENNATGNITNTAQNGTIKNEAKDIVNNATGDMTNTVGGKLTTTVTGQATENFNGGLNTTVTGAENHTVTGKQTNTVEGGQENIISGGQTNTITGGQINNITGDQTTTITGNKTETVTENVTEDYKKNLTTTVGGNEIHEVKGTKTETVEGKLTENFKGGQETNVTGDQTINVSGTQTTTATDIKRNASSGMIDTIDNDYGTNTETKVAGKTTTEVSIKGTGEEGKYIRGANESRDYLINGTLKNSETKTAEATSTEITDGTNKASTIQDAKNLAGSVTNGTETGVSGIHANKDGSVSIDSAVAGGGMSSVINQKKDSIQSAVGDGTNSTVIHQDKDNVTIASSNGMVGIVGKDIVNSAQNTITNTAGTSITNQVKDSKVTTDANGTTFENNTPAVSDGGATTTKINGNQITTGRVDANELGVSDKDGTNTADLSVKAGKGVKASASDGTTTGSLDVAADEVGSTVKDASGKGSTFKQRIDAIMGNVKTDAGESEVTQKGDEITSVVGKGEATNSRVTQKKGSLEAAVTDGTNTNVSYDVANASAKELTDGTNTSVQNQTASLIATGVKDGAGNENASAATATSSANTIKSGSKANTVISTADGTSFINSDAMTPVTDESGANAGTAVNTTIKGNTITTGKVTMDYAEVMKDLGVRGKTTTGSLEVTGASTLTGDVTMGSNATVKGNFNVEGNTNLKNTKVDGTLNVTQKATFDDSVSIAKDLSVDGNATIKGDVTANSYKVGDKTYISAAGINANDQKITNVADGSISEGSKDAVNGGQLYNVKNDLEGKVNKVGANAAAMANLHPMEFDPDSKWNIAAAIGNYGSETAAALGAFYRPNDDVMVNLSTAFGTGENMVGGGVSVRLGKGGNKLSREENNALKAQVDDLTARMDALLSVLNPNMSKDFPDVPENHWAYEAVSRLAGNDIVQGYPDGEFHGERTMTRYEMAEIIYNALSRGAEAERELVEEFKPELQAMAASEKATAERAEG